MSRRKRHRKEKASAKAAPGPAPVQATAPASSPPSAKATDGEARRSFSEGGPPDEPSLLTKVARGRWAPPAALAVLSLALYARTIGYPNYNSDAWLYLSRDPRLFEVSLANLWKVLTTTFAANYHPVTTLTYFVDRALFGTWLPGYHVTQLLWYAAGVVLVYYLFRMLIGSSPAALRRAQDGGTELVEGAAAFAGAALYATHAVHVEVVAWLAQRKDVVCLVFYVASIMAYVRYDRGEGSRRRSYAAAVALAALAMLAKGYAVILPGVFIAYDLCYGPSRASVAKPDSNDPACKPDHAGQFAERSVGARVLDKIPFVALAAAVTVATFLAQGKDSALLDGATLDITVGQRIAANAKAFAVYVGQSLLPVGLSFGYAAGPEWLSGWVAVLGVVLAAGAVAGFVYLRRRLPGAAFGIAIFVLPLATVMNVFWTLCTWINDRYLFLPTIGSSLALAAAGAWVCRRRGVTDRVRRLAIPGAVGGVVVLYAALTVSRIGVWQDAIHLWDDAVRKQFGLEGPGPVTAREFLARGVRVHPGNKTFRNLISAYDRAGRSDEARDLRTALASVDAGDDPAILLEAANEDIAAGRHDEAIARLGPLAESGKWDAAKAFELMGLASEKKGELDEARKAYRRAAERYAANRRSGAPAMLKLGELELADGNPERAADWARRAREEAATGDPRPLFLLVRARAEAGELEQAHALCEETLALSGRVPAAISFDFADVHKAMGFIAERRGRTRDVIRHYQDALRLSPGHPQASAMRIGIGRAAEKLGEHEAALRTFEEILRTAPDHPDRTYVMLRIAVAAENLGRNGLALRRYDEALAAAPDHPERAGILLKSGLVAERLGRVDEAVRRFEEALRVDPDYPDRAAVRARIRLLRSRGPGPGPARPAPRL